MTRKLAILALAFLWTLGASAAVNPGTISGTVRDTAGAPQMGAVVEILADSAARTQTVLTDTKGAFNIAGLLPGLYTIKVTAPRITKCRFKKAKARGRLFIAVGIIYKLKLYGICFVAACGHFMPHTGAPRETPKLRREYPGAFAWPWTAVGVHAFARVFHTASS